MGGDHLQLVGPTTVMLVTTALVTSLARFTTQNQDAA